MEVESLKKLQKLTEKCITDLTKKQDISPSETEAAKKGFELLDLIEYEIKKCEMKENGYSQYSGHDEMQANPRRYNIVSYANGYPMSNRSNGYYMDGPYYSRDGRSNGYYMDGPYYSRDGRSMGYGPMMPEYYGDQRGMSRHSINDRAVSCIEKMMDEAKSDYERQQLHRFIEMIRSAE